MNIKERERNLKGTRGAKIFVGERQAAATLARVEARAAKDRRECGCAPGFEKPSPPSPPDLTSSRPPLIACHRQLLQPRHLPLNPPLPNHQLCAPPLKYFLVAGRFTLSTDICESNFVGIFVQIWNTVLENPHIWYAWRFPDDVNPQQQL